MRTLSRSAVPALTTEQMRAVDQAMVEDLHIELVQMMENAGRNLAELAITRFSPTSVTVLAGPLNYTGVHPDIHCTVRHPSN